MHKLFWMRGPLMAKKVDAPEGGGKGKEAPAVAPPAVDEESGEEDEESEEEESEESGSDEESEEESEEEEEEEEEIDEEDKQLLKALKNPRTRKAALRDLAEQAKEELGDGKTPQKVKGAWKKTIREKFGREYEDVLGGVIEEAIQEAVSELNDRLTTTERNRITLEATRAENKFFKEYPDAKKVGTKMMAAMKKYPPSPETDPYEYMVDMYQLVSGRSGKPTSTSTDPRAERIKKNKETAGRPPSGKDPGGKVTTGHQGQVSLKDAIRFAEQGKRIA